MRRFQGYIYRCHKPRYAYVPLSMVGATTEGGRFNRQGTPALYTSTDPLTALAELQDGVKTIPPKTIVSYYVDIERIVDLSTDVSRAKKAVDDLDLSCEWERMKLKGGPVPSWDLADRFKSAGANGMLVPSYAVYAPSQGCNLVLWSFSGVYPQYIDPHDPQSDLPKNEDSWA